MPTKTVRVTRGGWRTLEWFFGATGEPVAEFLGPAGAQIKVRYGVSFLGFDRQRQTLDGDTVKRLSIGTPIGARMQIRVIETSLVTYTVNLT